MTNNLNSINSIETTTDSNKSSKFIENTKRAVRDVLVKTGIAASTMFPMSATASTTTMPTCVNTTTQTSPSNNYTEPRIESELPKTDITRGEAINTEGKSGYTSETRADNQNNSIEYKAMEINNIRPVDILPIIGQIEAGDKKAYEHIEHLRIAEATRIRDMMREYGAGNHSPQEYQQLMNRLNTGMTMENPKGYNNYETIGGDFSEAPSDHAHDERDILNTLINHANFKVSNPTNGEMHEHMQTEVNNNPNNIYIFGQSSYAEVDKENYSYRNNNELKNLYKSKNFLMFVAGSNIKKKGGILKNKIYHENINGDEHGIYAAPSRANGKNDSKTDIHLIVTVGTNADGDIDQTNEIYESSKYPVGFHNDVLFAGRTFPYSASYLDGEIEAEKGKYATSYVNYTNVAVADLCFQMFAEVEDVDKLLEMIRNSTDFRDYIRFDLNGDGDTNDTHDGQPESQPLILMNPAGFFQKYLMPTSLPTNLKADETIALNKGYYHGIIYQIPGAEVKINNQWIAFTDNNKDLILSQNPMNLEWRLNGEVLNSYNYKPGDTVNGQIIVVDDNWNGLNISKDFSFTVDNANSINTPEINSSNQTWYTINGYRLNSRPTKPGIYIVDGQKVIIK